MNRRELITSALLGTIPTISNAPETPPDTKPPSKTPALDTLWGFGKVIEPNKYLFKISHTEGVMSPGELTTVYDTLNRYFPNNESLMMAYPDKWGYWEDAKSFCVNNIEFIYNADFAIQSLRGELIVYSIGRTERYTDGRLYIRMKV